VPLAAHRGHGSIDAGVVNPTAVRPKEPDRRGFERGWLHRGIGIMWLELSELIEASFCHRPPIMLLRVVPLPPTSGPAGWV
jgi:hypothetical protein